MTTKIIKDFKRTLENWGWTLDYEKYDGEDDGYEIWRNWNGTKTLSILDNRWCFNEEFGQQLPIKTNYELLVQKVIKKYGRRKESGKQD